MMIFTLLSSGSPRGIAVDKDNDKLFWSDVQGNSIGSSNRDETLSSTIVGNLIHPIGISSNWKQALPVELITFTATTISTNGSVYINLNWDTATEVNNYGFEVERASTSLSISTIPSGDEGWENIGFVEGNGNSNSKKQYLFADNSVSESGRYSYRLKQIDIDGHYKYSQSIDINFGIPEKFEVSQNYPNPFNPSTTISYSIPKRSNVTIEIFNMLGQRITNLIQKEHLPGNYKIDFDASKLSSGIYIYKVSTSNQNIIRKMMILK